jgi:hypothetical protein
MRIMNLLHVLKIFRKGTFVHVVDVGWRDEKQDGNVRMSVALRRVRVTIVAVEKQ